MRTKPSSLPKSRRPTPAPKHPEPLDPLSQVLDSIRLRCMLPSAHEMTAPWGLQFGEVSHETLWRHFESLNITDLPHDPPPFQGAIIAILRGSCCLEIPRQNLKLPLAGGDIVLICRKDPFILRDDWRTPARNVFELIRREDFEHFRGISHGGGGVPTTFLCGAFCFEDEEDHPLLSALSPLIHIRGSDPAAAPWLDSTLRFLNSELTTLLPGCRSVVNHLAQVLFVQAVRVYASTTPQGSRDNWFGALFDPDLAPALGAMHSRPEEPWTVATLADQACLSRSAFSERFTARVGHSPLQYLTACRMRKAKQLLRQTALGVKIVAAKVGYSNESAFSNAFRRLTGTSPGTYRRSHPNDQHPA